MNNKESKTFKYEQESYVKNLTPNRPRWYSAWLKKNDYINIPCADHIKFTKTSHVILEPYECSMSNVKNLIDLCEKENWDFYITGTTVHFPNWTFRIEIFKKEDDTNE